MDPPTLRATARVLLAYSASFGLAVAVQTYVKIKIMLRHRAAQRAAVAPALKLKFNRYLDPELMAADRIVG